MRFLKQNLLNRSYNLAKILLLEVLSIFALATRSFLIIFRRLYAPVIPRFSSLNIVNRSSALTVILAFTSDVYAITKKSVEKLLLLVKVLVI